MTARPGACTDGSMVLTVPQLRHGGRRYVRPRLPAVARDVNEPVVGAHPQQPLGERRLFDHQDGVVDLAARYPSFQAPTVCRLLLRLVVPSQVAADHLPGTATIARAMH